MSIPEYSHLRIIGDISVEPVTEKVPGDAMTYILYGPTGAGKSCYLIYELQYKRKFIQALAGDSQDLGISKDQLAGFTQKASAYKLVNVLFRVEEEDRPIYLMDTPGFSDPKISSLGVFESQTPIYEESSYVKHLFLTPVTDTRMPGSRRRTIETLTTWFQPPKYHTAFTIVTTMWNTLHTERAHQHAEVHYEQLRDNIFKAFGSILNDTPLA
ncbi:hypothetical protein BJ165DRAFT_1534450 [Panaeolus papilionaceus]|nr:hypothetical protein BJ165DRAFT_1534450 [Panaeolus papilionaceus]